MTTQPPIEALSERLRSQRAAFAAEPYPTLARRREWIDRILDMTARYQSEIVEAARADFGGRAPAETTMVEVFGTTANAAQHETPSEEVDAHPADAHRPALPARLQPPHGSARGRRRRDRAVEPRLQPLDGAGDRCVRRREPRHAQAERDHARQC